MVSPKPLSVFVPDVTLIAFPIPMGLRPQGGRTFSSRESRVPFASRKMVFDTDIEGKFRRKTRIRPGSVVSLRRFRRLFAAVQSSASSKLSNPLINHRFLVLPWSAGANGRLPHHLAGTTAEIMTKACASGQSSVIERSIRAS
jgi:hypothetical protein